MTARVGIYSHAGLSTPPIAGSNGKLSTDSVMLLKQPYLAGEVLTADSVAVTSSANTAPSGTKLLRVEVAPSERVYYEVTPLGQDLRTATTSSPILEGNSQIEFGPQWRLSVLLVS